MNLTFLEIWLIFIASYYNNPDSVNSVTMYINIVYYLLKIIQKF